MPKFLAERRIVIGRLWFAPVAAGAVTARIRSPAIEQVNGT
jgi:hypothetical protein